MNKKNIFKKAIVLVLAVILVLTLIPAGVFADSDQKEPIAKETNVWPVTINNFDDLDYVYNEAAEDQLTESTFLVVKGTDVDLFMYPEYGKIIDTVRVNGVVTELEDGEHLKFTPTGETKIDVVVRDMVAEVTPSKKTIDFGRVLPGYEQPEPVVISIKNTGERHASLERPVLDNYIINILEEGEPVNEDYEIFYLAPGEELELQIQPEGDLPLGDYSGKMMLKMFDMEAPRVLINEPVNPECIFTTAVDVSFKVGEQEEEKKPVIENNHTTDKKTDTEVKENVEEKQPVKKAEVLPEKEQKQENPKTGDNSNLLFYVLLLSAGTTALFGMKKKMNK